MMTKQISKVYTPTLTC